MVRLQKPHQALFHFSKSYFFSWCMTTPYFGNLRYRSFQRKIQMEMVLRDIMAVMHMAMFHSWFIPFPRSRREWNLRTHLWNAVMKERDICDVSRREYRERMMISLYISLCLGSEIGNTQISQMSRSRLLFLIGGVVSKPCLLPKTIDVSEGDIREILGCHRRTHILKVY